jgi:hypothetical protein
MRLVPAIHVLRQIAQHQIDAEVRQAFHQFQAIAEIDRGVANFQSFMDSEAALLRGS